MHIANFTAARFPLSRTGFPPASPRHAGMCMSFGPQSRGSGILNPESGIWNLESSYPVIQPSRCSAFCATLHLKMGFLPSFDPVLFAKSAFRAAKSAIFAQGVRIRQIIQHKELRHKQPKLCDTLRHIKPFFPAYHGAHGGRRARDRVPFTEREGQTRGSGTITECSPDIPHYHYK